MNNYGELLKDPRWQQKRLKIMERDKWTCQLCGEKGMTFNVHHMWYGDEPWNVPDYLLITLCEPCHKMEEGVKHSAPGVLATMTECGFLKMDMMNLCLAAFEYAERGGAGGNRDRLLKVIEVVKGLR